MTNSSPFVKIQHAIKNGKPSISIFRAIKPWQTVNVITRPGTEKVFFFQPTKVTKGLAVFTAGFLGRFPSKHGGDILTDCSCLLHMVH